jgi:hypothetical protein
MSTAARLAAANFFIFMENVMYSNEKDAILSALDAVAGAFSGEDVPASVTVEGGRAYDGTREVCAKILDIATSVKALVARVVVLET